MAPTDIFTEDDGSPMRFYVAMSVPERLNLLKEIENHGGCIIDSANDGYFLVNPTKPLQMHTCYDFSFITKSIKEGSLLDMKSFHLKGPTAPKSGRTPFTEEDNRILLEYVNSSNYKMGNSIYKEIEKKYPHHPWSSWRDHYIEMTKGSLKNERNTVRPAIPRFQPDNKQKTNVASTKAAKEPTPNSNNRQLQQDQDDSYFEDDEKEGGISTKSLSRPNVPREIAVNNGRQEDMDEEDREMDSYLLAKIALSERPQKFPSPLKGGMLQEKSEPASNENRENSVVENQRDSGVGIYVDSSFALSRAHSFRYEERRAPSPEDRNSRHSSEWERSRINRKRKITDEELEELERRDRFGNKSRRFGNGNEDAIVIPDDTVEQEKEQEVVTLIDRQMKPQKSKSDSEQIMTETPEPSQSCSQFSDYYMEPDDKLEKQFTTTKSNKKHSISQQPNTKYTSVKGGKRSDSNSSNKYDYDQNVFLGLLKGLTVDFKVDLSKAVETYKECKGDFELARKVLNIKYGRHKYMPLPRKRDFKDKTARIDGLEKNNSRNIPWTNGEDKIALGVDSDAITQLKNSKGASEVTERTNFLRKTLR